jgi:hypothetical protein
MKPRTQWWQDEPEVESSVAPPETPPPTYAPVLVPDEVTP